MKYSYFELPYHRHLFPTRLCPVSPTLLPVYKQLHLQPSVNNASMFANDITLIGLISGEDESAYKWEIDHLVSLCRQNSSTHERQWGWKWTYKRTHPRPRPSSCVSAPWVPSPCGPDLTWPERVYFIQELKYSQSQLWCTSIPSICHLCFFIFALLCLPAFVLRLVFWLIRPN